MVRIQTHSDQQADDCQTGSACAAGNHTDIVDILAHQFQCVEHRCQRNDCRAVLVIVENRNVAAFLQAAFDFKAAWCGDVLQVHAAETAGDEANCLHDLVHILGADAERNRIHVAETLEQCALAFHDRHTSLRADIAQTQNSRAVCDNSDQVAPAGQVIALGNIFLNFQAGLCNAGRIRQRKIIGGFSGARSVTSILPCQS